MKKGIIKQNWALIIIGIYIFVFIFYAFVFKDRMYIPIHDSLDWIIPWFQTLKNTNTFFAHDVTVPFLGGVDRDLLVSEFQAYTWLYILFSTYTAYILGEVIRILLSLYGSIKLGKILLGENYETCRNVVQFCGFVYGLIPVITGEGFGFASIPLLIALINEIVIQKKKWKIIFVFLYPILSSFVYFGIFICGYLLIYLIVDWIKNRKFPWTILSILLSISVGYILVEYRLFGEILLSGTATIRDVFPIEHISVGEIVREIIKVFIRGHYHSGDMHLYVIFPVCVIYILVEVNKHIKEKNIKAILKEKWLYILALIVFNCLIYGLDDWDIFKIFIKNYITPLTGFSFARTLWLNPFLWYLLFTYILCRLVLTGWKKLTIILSLASFGIMFFIPDGYNYISANTYMAAYDITKISFLEGQYETKLSYVEFYSCDLFDEIKEDIDYIDEKSVAYGFHPGILYYNGIVTLDGYLQIYPLEYKMNFRKIIEPQLEKSHSDKEYFDTWGARAYIFGAPYQPVRTMNPDSYELNINSEAFAELGGKYIFSRVKILNADELNFECIGKYENSKSPYTIYVYECKG